MVWHDCKTDPPKEEGFYLLEYNYEVGEDGIFYDFNNIYDRALYKNNQWSLWENQSWVVLKNIEFQNCYPLKWAEVDLSEVE